MDRLFIANGRLLDPEKMQIRPAGILIEGGLINRVVEKGSPAATAGAEVIDAAGRYVAPGLIDAHLHIESSMLTPDTFAAAAVPRGTTAVFVDPHEIGNVRKEGIELFLDISSHLPYDMYVGVSSCVPATELESSGARVTLEDVARLIDHPRAYGLAEMMNYPGIIHGFGDARAKVDLVFEKGKIVDGHAPGVRGEELKLYVTNGKNDGVVRIMSDHESTTYEEAAEKAGLGMYVALRYGSASKDMDAILPVLIKSGRSLDRFMLCSDDLEAEEMLVNGHMDQTVRRARQIILDNSGLGLEQATLLALRLACLNSGRYFRKFFDVTGKPGMGAIETGATANLIIIDDLEKFEVNEVIAGGRRVASGGRLTGPAPHFDFGRFLDTVNPGRSFEGADFRIECPDGRAAANVIGVIPSSLLTRKLRLEVTSAGGGIQAEPERDLAKIAVIERHKATGHFSVGLVQGLGIRRGAVASTVAHDSHNIIVAGLDEKSMALAVNELAAKGGGMIAVDSDGAGGARIAAFHQLEVAGLMSTRPAEEVAASYKSVREAASDLGSPLANVFMTLSFLALAVIPELKITDRGLVDVTKFQHIGVRS